MDTVLIVLTARMGSERLPGKVLEEIGGQPLLSWIYTRLSRAGRVVLATTRAPEDDALAAWARDLRIPYYRGLAEDVLGRIMEAYKELGNGETLIMRGLGDCPFPNPQFIRRAARVLGETERQVFCWCLPPYVWPVYGSREFPMHKSAWDALARVSQIEEEREHPDLGLHRRRKHFLTVYHEPPPPQFFRPRYRLEVDYPEDVAFLRAVYDQFGYWPEVEELIELLDIDPKLAAINAGCAERTGPLVSFTKAERLGWLDDLEGQPVKMWDDSVWEPVHSRGKPIFCHAGLCLIGYYGRGILRLRNGVQIHTGTVDIPCACGAGRRWRPVRGSEHEVE